MKQHSSKTSPAQEGPVSSEAENVAAFAMLAEIYDDYAQQARTAQDHRVADAYARCAQFARARPLRPQKLHDTQGP